MTLLIWGSHGVQCIMVEQSELGTWVSDGPGSALATFRCFSCKASRAGPPAAPVLMGLVGLLRNQSVTLATARELFRGNYYWACLQSSCQFALEIFIYFLICYELTEEKKKVLTELVVTAWKGICQEWVEGGHGRCRSESTNFQLEDDSVLRNPTCSVVIIDNNPELYTCKLPREWILKVLTTRKKR